MVKHLRLSFVSFAYFVVQSSWLLLCLTARAGEPPAPAASVAQPQANVVSGVVVKESGGSLAGAAHAADPPAPGGKQVKFIVVAKATGKPIAGARVQFEQHDDRKLLTDKNGVALATGLPAEYCHVRIFADGFARTRENLYLSAAADLVTRKVELEPGGTIRGVVVDESGKPVAQMNVEFNSTSSGASWPGDEVRTDKDGKFQDRHAPLDDPLTIAFNNHGFVAKQIGTEEQGIALSADNPQEDFKVVMQRAASGPIVGTVVDAAEHPVAGANIIPVRSDLGLRGAVTDAKGRFRLEEADDQGSSNTAPDATYSLHVAAKGFAPRFFSGEIEVGGKGKEITITLQRGHTIHGIVVDENGVPVTSATVTAQSLAFLPFHPGTDPRNLDPTKFTDNQGKFYFDSLPADTQFEITSFQGYYAERVDVKLDSPQPVKCVVESPGEIRGRVIDAESGKPIPNFHVEVNFCRELAPADPHVGFFFQTEWFSPGKSVHAADGRFAIKSLVNRNPVLLIVSADGYERSVVRHAVAHHAKDAPELKIALLPIKFSDYCTVRGRLIDVQGNGIARANLRLIVRPSDYQPFDSVLERYRNEDPMLIEQQQTTSTDAEGRFEFKQILPGRSFDIEYHDGSAPGLWHSERRTPRGKEMSITIKKQWL